jgi:predicted phosphate transport protein (TIGR00153 family)
MGFSLVPREDDYFKYFAEIGNKIQEASGTLVEMLSSDSESFEKFVWRIKDLEHECDELTHKITTKLNKSFITPFDREDIYTLSVALDDVCDYIDAAARAILMYNIRDINDHTKHLGKVIHSLAMEINSAILLLKNPNGINQHIVEIHRLENEADDAYYRGIGELFQKESDPITLIKLKELYEIMENTTDRCESVANIIESIILKHS